MLKYKVEWENGIVVKRGVLLDFIVKNDISYGIIKIGNNLKEIKLDNLKIAEEEKENI